MQRLRPTPHCSRPFLKHNKRTPTVQVLCCRLYDNVEPARQGLEVDLRGASVPWTVACGSHPLQEWAQWPLAHTHCGKHPEAMGAKAA